MSGFSRHPTKIEAAPPVKFVSILRLRDAILGLQDWRRAVDSQGAQHLVHFLAAKRSGVNTQSFVKHSEYDDRRFCEDALKVRPGSEPFYDPISDAFRISTHYHSNVATARKKTFADRWKAAEYRSANHEEEWKFTEEYIPILVNRMLTKAGVVTQVPAYDLCAWLYRSRPFPSQVHVQNVIELFCKEYNFDRAEFDALFTTRARFGQAEASTSFFGRARSSDALILQLVSNPQDFDMSEAIAAAGEEEGRPVVNAQAVADILTNGRKQVMLQGPPGTGKTRLAKEVAALMLGLKGLADLGERWLGEEELDSDPQDGAGGWCLVQFHPSYAYEDFVRGIRADVTKAGTPFFKVQDRLFAKLCAFARRTAGPVLLVIDEINRGDLSKLLGELVYALEYRGEPVSLQYATDDGKTLVVPSNLYIIATMNTADRSIAHIDYAIRRRFDFVQVPPDPAIIESVLAGAETKKAASLLFAATEELLASDPDRAIGHSYFLHADPAKLASAFALQVLPLLAEY